MARDDWTQANDRRLPRAGRPPLGIAYWRLWTSSGLSNLADGVVKIALPLVALRFTQSPTLIAGLAFALTLPWLLFALPAGALADRLDRRRAMLGANTVRAALVVVLVLAVMVDIGSIWVLYAVAFCIGVAETIYDTSAQSILPLVVSRDRLSRANGLLFAAELTANEFVGPPLGRRAGGGGRGDGVRHAGGALGGRRGGPAACARSVPGRAGPAHHHAC